MVNYALDICSLGTEMYRKWYLNLQNALFKQLIQIWEAQVRIIKNDVHNNNNQAHLRFICSLGTKSHLNWRFILQRISSRISSLFIYDISIIKLNLKKPVTFTHYICTCQPRRLFKIK